MINSLLWTPLAFGLLGLVIGPVVVATMTSLLAAYTGPRTAGTGARPRSA